MQRGFFTPFYTIVYDKWNAFLGQPAPAARVDGAQARAVGASPHFGVTCKRSRRRACEPIGSVGRRWRTLSAKSRPQAGGRQFNHLSFVIFPSPLTGIASPKYVDSGLKMHFTKSLFRARTSLTSRYTAPR